MRKLFFSIALLLFLPSAVQAQCNGIFANGTVCGNISGGPSFPRPINAAQAILSSLCTTTGAVPVRISTGWICSSAIGNFLAKLPSNNNYVGTFPFGSIASTNYAIIGDGTGVDTSLYINRPTGGNIIFRENNGSNQVVINSGGTLQILPTAATKNQGLVVTQTPSSAPLGVDIDLNSISITSDNATVTGANFVRGLHLSHFYGGAAMVGNRNSLEVTSQLSTTSGNSSGFYGAASFNVVAGANDNGTGVTGLTAKGAFFGTGISATSLSGATNLLELTGGEVDIALVTGSSAYFKAGWTIVQLATDAIQGAVYDAGLNFSNNVGAVGWKSLIEANAANGVWPLATTGCFICTQDAGSKTIGKGIDLSGIGTITGNAFASPGFSVTGLGVVTAPSINLSATSNQIVFQSAGVTGTLSWSPATSNKSIKLPNGTTDFTATGGTSQFVKQSSAGGALTVAAILASELPAGVWTNTRLSKTANYTLVTGDCGSTVALGGSAFYTLTVNAASGYSATCVVAVVNEDSVRGKTLAINGLTSFVLYPLQTLFILNDNNTWQLRPSSQRWKLTGSVTVYVDQTNGSDSNDCLAVTTGACATISAALTIVNNALDFGNQAVTVSVACPGVLTYTTGARIRPWIGAGSLTLLGNTATPTNCVIGPTSADAVQITDGALPGPFTVNGFKLQTTTSGHGIDAQSPASITYSNINFGAVGGGAYFHVLSAASAFIVFGSGSYTISGTANTHAYASTGGLIRLNSAAVVMSGNPTIGGQFAVASHLGYIEALSFTFSGTATNTVAKENTNANGVIDTNGNCASTPPGGMTTTYFPGVANGGNGSGGQCL